MAEPSGGRGDEAHRLDEDSLIARYFRPLAEGFPGADALRDDAAAFAPPPGCDVVVTTDALIADVHFFAADAPADIAYKALAVNVSDLAAKAADPIAYSLALALPRGVGEDWLRDFTDGLREAQAHFGIALSGGDTTVSPAGPLTIAITAFGCVPRGTMPRRGGARVGDSLYASGSIGDAALGLRLRSGEPGASNWPLTPEDRAALVARYLRPDPRLALRDALRAHASAAMDISDGLVIDCGRMCAASGVAGIIEAAAVPLSAPVRAVVVAHEELFEAAITGGDDYEILAAIRAGEEAAFEAAARAAGVPVTHIGSFVQGRGAVTVIGSGDCALPLARTGYDHFAG